MYQIGSIVRARGRDWIVQPGSGDDRLLLRPLAGSDADECLILPDLESEPPGPASFAPPDSDRVGDARQAELLRDAFQMKLRNGAGPFRSFGNLAVEPRPYQFVPLLMALRLPVVRLLVADDVGIGKTIEAGLVLRELLDRGEVERAVVLCPPHLVDQWISELSNRFHVDAVALTSRTAVRLERALSAEETVFSRNPFLVVSLDYIKGEARREAFLAGAPSFVIVDEAHTCVHGGPGRQYRWELLQRLVADPARHLLLLTGTPHSGDTDAFYNLLSLLDPRFLALKNDTSASSPLRAELARHFVQRCRNDILSKEWGGGALFPKREITEETYALPDVWRQYLTGIYEFCRSLANEEAANQARRDFNGYTALALLRCASSSPAAAVKAFDSKLARVSAPAGASPPESDPDADADLLGDIPGLYDDADGEEEPDTEADLTRLEKVQGLRRFRDEAARLAESGDDPKLACLVAFLKRELLKGRNPFHPIVFCRYIETAAYVGKALREAFPKFELAVVTGRNAPDERAKLVRDLAAFPQRILVATDCLSEGINLQDSFDAVVHYDMVWNPTRHEQREGRVDRYGQRRDVVRCALLYGKDNPVDGLVLDNIVRKAETIRKELGVAVPVPVDDRGIKSAILASFRMRRLVDPRQMDFSDLLDAGTESFREIDRVWQDAREREKINRTVFAQRAIHPEAVQTELEKSRAMLGSPDDVLRFVRGALVFLGAPLGSETDGVFPFDPRRLPVALFDRLAEAGVPVDAPIHLAFQQQDADRRPGVRFVRRTDPLVSTLADFVVETALSGEAPTGLRPAARCAVVRTRAVTRRTILLVQRLRHLVRSTGPAGEKTLVGEEIALQVAEGDGSFRPLAAGSDEARALFGAEPAGNLSPEAVRRELDRAAAFVAAQDSVLAASARDRAAALLADHRAVRDAAGFGGRYAVEAVLPADAIGLYVFLPAIQI